jgi:ribosome-binding factor A
MSKRVEQVESVIKREISSVIARGLSDPRAQGVLITVTRVKVSPDLRDAMVFISILPQQHEKRALAALRHATRHIQAEASRHIALRTMPRVDFRLDSTLKKQAEVHEAIQRALEREQPTPTDLPEEPRS